MASPKAPDPPPLPPIPPEVREEDLTARRRLRGATLISGGASKPTLGSTLIGG